MYIYGLQQTHLRSEDTHRLKVKGWKQIFHANGKEKNAGVAVLTFDKMDFKTKTQRRTLYSDKGNNPTKGYNSSKQLYSKCRSP